MTAEQTISPRSIARKSDPEALDRAIALALGLESVAVRHNTQNFNDHRYAATSELADYEALKATVRGIKERSIDEQPELVEALRTAITGRGGHFYLAETAEDACRLVLGVCQGVQAALVVKAKSMTSEEIHLNRVLEGAGIEVAETDLAEFILQVCDEQPSHIVAPAIHYSRERITALFKEKFKTSLPLETGEELTRFARERLREKFLRADVGITGANLIAAETGTLMLVESEGNIRMTSLLPPIHVAIAGIEKVIRSRADMGPFLELLARSATGQRLSGYTSFISPPLPEKSLAFYGRPTRERAFHLVLIDNGRSRMRADPVLKEALYCIRCSACLNVCANFQAVGGHAFGGETYSGGIGGAWEAGTEDLKRARFAELCTGCSRCVPQCPVQIDIPHLNEVLRNRLHKEEGGSLLGTLHGVLGGAAPEDRPLTAQRAFFGCYGTFAAWGARLAPVVNWFGTSALGRRVLGGVLHIDSRRPLPALRRPRRAPSNLSARKAVLLSDVFTTFSRPERIEAALLVLDKAGLGASQGPILPDSRAPLSQGMLATAEKAAREAAAVVGRFVEEGLDLVVVEPSVLSLFRRDYRRLLGDDPLFERLSSHTFEPIEYLVRALRNSGRSPRDLFESARSPWGERFFYHAHCQQKTSGAVEPTLWLLHELGFDVVTSHVECCGMAGSFGYKKPFYELSMNVGGDLFDQVRAADGRAPPPAGPCRRARLREGHEASRSSTVWSSGVSAPALRRAAPIWSRHPGFPEASTSARASRTILALRAPSSPAVSGSRML